MRRFSKFDKELFENVHFGTLADYLFSKELKLVIFTITQSINVILFFFFVFLPIGNYAINIEYFKNKVTPFIAIQRKESTGKKENCIFSQNAYTSIKCVYFQKFGNVTSARDL